MRPGGEHLAQEADYTSRLVIDLCFAEAEDLKSPLPQLEISRVIVRECLPATVISIAVGFHDDPPLAPQEVGLVRPHLDVDLRGGQSVPPADLQEVALQVAAGPIARRLAQRQPQRPRLSNRAPNLPGR